MSLGRLFGIAATAVGFLLIAYAAGSIPVLVFGVVVVAIGLGFFVYGDGR